MTYVNTASGREEAEVALRTELVIGGFLCAIGYGVVILGAWLFMKTWSGPSATWGVRTLVFGAVVLLLFYLARAADLRWQLRRHMRVPGSPPPPAESVKLAVGVLVLAPVLFILAVAVFWGLAKAEVKPPEKTRFALTLPAVEAPAASSQPIVINAGGKDALAPKQPPQPAAVLIWDVKTFKEPVPAGAPPIILGGLLVIGFGIFFPTVKLSESKDLVDSTQKLVAPILSGALVWLGAHQQADADHVTANTNLAEKGLPPVIEISGGPVRPLMVNEMSPQGLDYVGQAIDKLDQRLTNVSNSVDLVTEDVNSVTNSTAQLQTSLNVVQSGIAKLNPPPPVSLADLTNAVGAVGKRMDTVEGSVNKTYAVANSAFGVANTSLAQTNAALANTKNILSEVATDMQSVCAQTLPVLAKWTAQAKATADAESAYAATWHPATLLAGIGLGPDKKYGELRADHDGAATQLAQVTGARKAARCDT